MNAVFKVKNIKNSWTPPFKKEIIEQQYFVEEGQSFDEISIQNVGKVNVFKIIQLTGSKALIEYDRHFTLKDGINPGSRQLWITLKKPISFKYQWGNNGMTKILSFEAINESNETSLEKREEKEQTEVVKQTKENTTST